MIIPKLAHALVTLLTIVMFSFPTATPQTSLALSSNPTSVTIAGSFNSEIGCSSDWKPDCAEAHLNYAADVDVWKATLNLPAGNYEYKAALNDSWAESYGKGGSASGDNIS